MGDFAAAVLSWLTCGLTPGLNAPCCTSADTVVPLRFCARLATMWLGSRCSAMVGVPRSSAMDAAAAAVVVPAAAVTAAQLEPVVRETVTAAAAAAAGALMMVEVLEEEEVVAVMFVVDAVVLLLLLLVLLFTGELAAPPPPSPFTLWAPERLVRTVAQETCCFVLRELPLPGPLPPLPPPPLPLTGAEVPVSELPSDTDPVGVLLVQRLLFALTLALPPLSELELSGFSSLLSGFSGLSESRLVPFLRC